MNTPEQTGGPPLTRKQMRELRNTGANPIVAPSEPEEISDIPDVQAESAPAPTPPAPLPRAAVPAIIAEPPAPDSSVDLGVAPLTRRQARQQERIRTASVPVITPDAAAHAAAHTVAEHDAAPAAPVEEDFELITDVPAAETDEVAALLGVGVHDEGDNGPTAGDADMQGVPLAGEPERVVNPHLGAGLLAGEIARAELPPSFDQLLSRSTEGSTSMPNALIVSQTPSTASIVAPVTATGDVLVTGTFDLPEGLGSTGHAHGTADGKEVDAVLIDGELPAHSSPTPIAASAAISTHKAAGEIIQPPAPEKGSRLMMSLAITAGVLALALVGVLVLAFVTGVFS